MAEERWTRHPVVRTHPETGEQGLFVNPTYTRFIEGLPPDEGDTMLPFLIRHQVKEPFTYRHRWAEGDLLIWDNRSTMHMVLNDFEGHRLMYRVSVVGTAALTLTPPAAGSDVRLPDVGATFGVGRGRSG